MQWTVVDSNYPRFALSTCQTNVGLTAGGAGGHTSNQNEGQHGNATSSNAAVSSNHTQIQYQSSAYSSGQMITLNPNNLVNNYSASLSTPTSPQGNDSNIVQSVYSQGPTPNQSPVQMVVGGSGNNNQQQTTSSSAASQAAPQKRKRSVNPQGDENFLRALEAVRFGGIGFCKAARMYGVNNRTLWLEYKKRGYPISRPSIKNRIKLEPNMTPPPPTTPTNEENTSMENYEHNMTPNSGQQSSLNMSNVPPPAETPTSIMCPPHAHPMGVMSFLDTRHVEFAPGLHQMRQRYPDGAVNVNPSAINLQGLNFNSM